MGYLKPLSIMLVTAASVLLSPAPGAQDQTEEEITWYAVEVVIFERSSEMGRSAEFWPPEAGLPDIAGAVELSEEGTLPKQSTGEMQSDGDIITTLPSDAADAPPATTAPVFRRVPPEDYRLNDVWASLEKSSAYTPLLQISWIQPGVPSEQTRPIHIRNNNAALGAVSGGDEDLQTAPSEPGYGPTLSSRIRVARDPSKSVIDGTLRVHRARYLHVKADLLYYRPVDGDTGAPSNDDTGAATIPDSPDTAHIEQLLAEEDITPRLFRLMETRRMRSRELHYLDHPLFGMIVEAWPVDSPETPQAAPESVLQEEGGATPPEGTGDETAAPLPAATQSGSGG